MTYRGVGAPEPLIGRNRDSPPDVRAERERICAFIEQEAERRRDVMLAHADAGDEGSAREFEGRWREARDLALRIRGGARIGNRLERPEKAASRP